MAKNPVIFFSGTAGAIVSVKRYNQYYLRTLPEKVRQTAATKICSSNFAMASGAAKNLRNLLLPVIAPFDKITSIQCAFMGCFMRWLASKSKGAILPSGDIPFVNHFQFNNNNNIVNKWLKTITVTPVASNAVQVNLPAFVPALAMSAPANTVTVICKIVTACCRLTINQALAGSSKEFTFAYNHTLIAAQTIVIPALGINDTLVVTAISVRYQLASGAVYKGPVFMPSEVIGAMYR